MANSSAFYCVTNRVHFLGTVALLNSIRLVGHQDPFFVLDCGLAANQRTLLEPHVTLVPAPATPLARLVKWFAPLEHPADRMILLDSDVIAARPLTELIERAEGGVLVGFADDRPERFFAAWGEVLETKLLRRHTYLNSGFFVLPGNPGLTVLQLLRTVQLRIAAERPWMTRISQADEPFYYPDQDAWNAVFNGLLRPDQLSVLEHRLAPFAPFKDIRVADERTLRCSYADGTEPFLLHHVNQKPWLDSTTPNVYSQLLPRLLLESDVELRLPAQLVPLRLKKGSVATLERLRVQSVAAARGGGFRPRAAWRKLTRQDTQTDLE